MSSGLKQLTWQTAACGQMRIGYISETPVRKGNGQLAYPYVFSGRKVFVTSEVWVTLPWQAQCCRCREQLPVSATPAQIAAVECGLIGMSRLYATEAL